MTKIYMTDGDNTADFLRTLSILMRDLAAEIDAGRMKYGSGELSMSIDTHAITLGKPIGAAWPTAKQSVTINGNMEFVPDE